MNVIKQILLFLAVVLGTVSSMKAESKDVTIHEGETQTLYLPSSVTSKNLKSVNFYSCGISYVQVLSHTNTSVTVKAIKAFSSPIIVRCDYYYYVRNGNYTYETKEFYDFNVTVVGDEGGNKINPTGITFPSSAVGIEVGETRQLTCTVYPSNAEYTLTWSINDQSVASVSQTGLLTGKKEGAADLTVRADNGVYAMLRVVVSKATPSSIYVSPVSVEMKEGEETYISATIYPSSGNQTITWSSSNSGVATVNSNGKVTAISHGDCVVKASISNSIYANCHVHVSPNIILPSSINISPENVTIDIDEAAVLTASVSPSNASTSISWSSSDNDVATVTYGIVTGHTAGSCKITAATDNGLAATAYITVKEKEIIPESIKLTPDNISMYIGDIIALTTYVQPEDADVDFQWSSSNEDVAVVDNGNVTAISDGECMITVTTQNGLSSTCFVKVENNSEPPIEPIQDWEGTYLIHSAVDLSEKADYSYPSEFSMTVVKGDDDCYYITSFIGFDCLKVVYPATGLKLKVSSSTEATIDLPYSNYIGSHTIDDKYIEGLHLISSENEYDYGDGNITIHRNGEQVYISDFYVYCFGLETDFEFMQMAHYSACQGQHSEEADVMPISNDMVIEGEIEIYSLSGQCVYIGLEDASPELKQGVYIIRKRDKTFKIRR